MSEDRTEILFDPEEAKARGLDTRTIARARWAKQAREEGRLLLPEIEKAFDGVPRPRVTIAVAGGYDNEWNLSPEREAELRALNPEEDWHDVDVSGTHAHWYFNFADDAGGCRFYLPAFLREALKEFPFSERDGILWLLTSASRIALLDEAQMSCLTRFAELCERYPESFPDE